MGGMREWLLRGAHVVALSMPVVVAFFSFASAGAAESGFIGMQVQGMSPDISEALGLSRARGVMVRDVALGGPADKAGFRRGDIILSFAGKDIETFKQLVEVVRTIKAGQELTATVRRREKQAKLALKAGKWLQPWLISKGSFTTIPETGLTLSALTQKVRERFGLRWGSTGVVITLVDPNKAEGIDLRRGELILQVNQEDVWKPKQVAAKYRQAKDKGKKFLILLVEGVNGFRFSLLKVK